MLCLPKKLRYMIMDYLLPDNIQDHTFHFGSGFPNGRKDIPYDQIRYLAGQPAYLIAQMQACRQLKTSGVVQLLSGAHN
jgi:hypothetical protein